MASLYEVNLQSLYKALKRLAQASKDVATQRTALWIELDASLEEANHLIERYEALYSIRATD